MPDVKANQSKCCNSRDHVAIILVVETSENNFQDFKLEIILFIVVSCIMKKVFSLRMEVL